VVEVSADQNLLISLTTAQIDQVGLSARGEGV